MKRAARKPKRKPDPLDIVHVEWHPEKGWRWCLDYGTHRTEWSLWYVKHLTAVIDAVKAAESVSQWR